MQLSSELKQQLYVVFQDYPEVLTDYYPFMNAVHTSHVLITSLHTWFWFALNGKSFYPVREDEDGELVLVRELHREPVTVEDLLLMTEAACKELTRAWHAYTEGCFRRSEEYTAPESWKQAKNVWVKSRSILRSYAEEHNDSHEDRRAA